MYEYAKKHSWNLIFQSAIFIGKFCYAFCPWLFTKTKEAYFFRGGGGGGEYIWSDFCPPNSPCKTCVFLGVFFAGSEKNYIYIVFGYTPKSCDKTWKYTCIYFLLYHYTFNINICSWRTQISTIIPRLAGQSNSCVENTSPEKEKTYQSSHKVHHYLLLKMWFESGYFLSHSEWSFKKRSFFTEFWV